MIQKNRKQISKRSCANSIKEEKYVIFEPHRAQNTVNIFYNAKDDKNKNTVKSF